MKQNENKALKWGVLGAATIAIDQVIPALLESEICDLTAIASRDFLKAKEITDQFHIPNYFDSYEKLLESNDVDAVYIPLPNHLHVKWAIMALKKGKHVLIEKPIGMTAFETDELIQASKEFTHLKVMEAFMYRFHPQWKRVINLLGEGAIGEVRLVEASFSFFEDDPNSIVNSKECGGGSLMDVGCYPVSIARLIFGAEPISVMANMDLDPHLGVDLSTSGILEFEHGRAIIYSSIRQFENQTVKISGTEGKIVVELPFNPSKDEPSKLTITRNQGSADLFVGPCHQYLVQVESFARAVIDNKEVPVSLYDSLRNMKVIDALKESHEQQRKIMLE